MNAVTDVKGVGGSIVNGTYRRRKPAFFKYLASSAAKYFEKGMGALQIVALWQKILAYSYPPRFAVSLQCPQANSSHRNDTMSLMEQTCGGKHYTLNWLLALQFRTTLPVCYTLDTGRCLVPLIILVW